MQRWESRCPVVAKDLRRQEKKDGLRRGSRDLDVCVVMRMVLGLLGRKSNSMAKRRDGREGFLKSWVPS